MTDPKDLSPYEFAHELASGHLDRDYMLMLSSYSIGYLRGLRDAAKDKGSEQ